MDDKQLPIEQEIKDFIKVKLEKGLEDPEKLAENIYKDMKKHWMFGKRSFQPWVESPEINPFVNMVITRSGLLPLITLHILNSQQMFGNQLMNEIEKKTNKAWSPNPGSIYPLLKELEEEKLIKGRWCLKKEHPRRIYKITNAGKKEYGILKAVLKNQLKESIWIFNDIFHDIFSSTTIDTDGNNVKE